MNTLQKFELARASAAKQTTWLARAIWALRGPFWRSVEQVPTMAVSQDGMLYTSHEFVTEYDYPVLSAVIEHEAWHTVLMHAARAQAKKIMQSNAKAWNVAADAEIHSGHLRPESLSVLPDPVTPAALNMPEGLFAEEYYNRLPQVTPQVVGGSGSDGLTKPWEEHQDGDVVVAPITPAEAASIEKEVARRVEQEKARGNVPAGAARWASRALEPPKVDWRKVLRRLVQQGVEVTGRTDYSYRRPNRRDAGASRGYISPGTIAHQVDIAVVIDTSGSVSENGLRLALSETIGIARAVGGVVRAASCDAAATKFKRVRSVADVPLVGGGGTDMRVGIAAAMQLKPRPQTIVVITDGGTPWPEHRPSTPVIGVIVEGQDTTPEWMPAVVLAE